MGWPVGAGPLRRHPDTAWVSASLRSCIFPSFPPCDLVGASVFADADVLARDGAPTPFAASFALHSGTLTVALWLRCSGSSSRPLSFLGTLAIMLLLCPPSRCLHSPVASLGLRPLSFDSQDGTWDLAPGAQAWVALPCAARCSPLPPCFRFIRGGIRAAAAPTVC